MSSNLFPLYQKGVTEQFLLRLRTYDPEWRRIFHVQGTGERYIWAQGWQGYQLPQFRIPKERVAQDMFQASFNKAYIVRNYALGDTVAQEDIDDDLYGVIKFVLAQKGGFMAIAFQDLWQYQTAGFFQNQGFASGSSVAGMSDGKSLFNTGHPISSSNLGVTAANRPSVDADLSISSWQAMCINLWTQKAPNNLTYLNNKLKALVVNPQLHFVAHQIMNGKPYQAFSANLTPNVIDPVDIIEWPYFTKSGATGTNNAWFGLGEQHFLNFYMREAPKSKTDYDINTNSQILIMMTRADYGADDWRGTYGSVGG